MNNRYIKRFLVFAAMVVFLWPWFVNAKKESYSTFSHKELVQMIAPVALYPDPLLSQLLIAASYPYEVVEAERWLSDNPYLTGQALDEALRQKNWDISIASLCHYPKILTMMAGHLTWTAKLGDAFVYQEQEVMETVQELRAKALAQGNLATTSEQQVIIEGNIIRIEPAHEDYVYVPVYDPYTIYGSWHYPTHPPFVIYYPGYTLIGSRIVFSPGLYIGFGFFGWSSFNWINRTVVVVDIDRRKHYDRHAHAHRSAPRIPWRPDRQKRIEHRYRAPLPSPARPPSMPPPKVHERKVIKGRPAAPSVVKPAPVPPRSKERQPDIRRHTPVKPVPPQSKPPVIQRDKSTPAPGRSAAPPPTPKTGGFMDKLRRDVIKRDAERRENRTFQPPSRGTDRKEKSWRDEKRDEEKELVPQAGERRGKKQ
ncbi:MAG: DUF3300 domain-containing protein [Deltaproteobacteria bacterium]|nr:DUF3300 domain-containing protein [Deltaproteobacteria bacterium]